MQINSKRLTHLVIVGAFIMTGQLEVNAADEVATAQDVEIKFKAIDPKDCRSVEPEITEIKPGNGFLIFSFKLQAESGCELKGLPSSHDNGPQPMAWKSDDNTDVPIESFSKESFSVKYDLPTSGKCYRYSYSLANSAGATTERDWGVCTK